VSLYDLSKIVHFASMAVWLGAAMWVPGDVKRSLDLPGGPDANLPRRIRAALRLDIWGGIFTIFSGIALAWQGAAHARWIGVGFALSILLFMLVMVVLLPAGKRIAAAVETGGDLAEARGSVKQLAAFSGVAHLLWLAVLVEMVVRW
jgi:hypothetical protein